MVGKETFVRPRTGGGKTAAMKILGGKVKFFAKGFESPFSKKEP